MTNKTVWAWLGALVMAAVLAGCGGGTADDTVTQIRLLNASPDLSSANLYTDSDQRASGVVPDAISAYAELNPDSYSVKLSDAIGVTLATVTQELSKKTRYTAVAWGRSGATSLTLLTEADSDSDNMNSGWGRLRVFNGAGNEAGNLDIYLLPNSTTDLDTALSTATPAMAGTTTTVTSYSDLLAGTYRLVVTAASDTSDVRLDLPSFTLGNQQLLTLVLEPSSSGVLVHALLLTHQGSLAVAKNPSARVRVIASVPAKGAVTATAGGVTLGTNLASPSIGAYQLVTAGGSVVAITANGHGVAPSSNITSFAAGADYTLLVSGPADAPVEQTILDDNRLPTNSAKAKIRLLNGYASLATPATLSVDSVGIGSAITAPDATVYASVTASTTASISVTAGSTVLLAPVTNGTPLTAAGVYTVYILDGNTDADGNPQPMGLTRSQR